MMPSSPPSPALPPNSIVYVGDMAVPILEAPPKKRVVDAILKVIEAYRAQKAQGETLHQWVTKVVKGQGTGSIKSLDDVKALLAQVIQLPAIEQDPDAYRDYGSDAKFTAKTARGECAA